MTKWIPNLAGVGKSTCKKVARIATLAENAKQLEVEMNANEPVRVGDILMGDYREDNSKLYHSTPWWVERVEYRWPENVCRVQAREMKTDGEYLSTYRIYDKVVKYMRYKGLLCFTPAENYWPTFRHDQYRSNANLGATILVIPEDQRLIFVNLECLNYISLKVPSYSGQPLVDPYGFIWLRTSSSSYFRINLNSGRTHEIRFEQPIKVIHLREDCAVLITVVHNYEPYTIILLDYYGHIIQTKTIENPSGWDPFYYPVFVDTNNQIHAFFDIGSGLSVQKFNEQLEPIGEPKHLASFIHSLPMCNIETPTKPIAFVKTHFDIVRYHLGSYNKPPQGTIDTHTVEEIYPALANCNTCGCIHNSLICQYDYYAGGPAPWKYYSGYYIWDYDVRQDHILFQFTRPGLGCWSRALSSFQSRYALLYLINCDGNEAFYLYDIYEELKGLMPPYTNIYSVHWISKDEYVVLVKNDNTWSIQIYDIEGNLIRSGEVERKSNLVGDTIVV